MNHINFFEAMRTEFDLEGIIKVVFSAIRAYCRDEIDDNAVGPLLTLAFSINDDFQQSLRRQRGTKTTKEEGAKRRAVWQKEANEVSRENSRMKKNAVAEQVRINLGCEETADTISRVIKLPKK